MFNNADKEKTRDWMYKDVALELAAKHNLSIWTNEFFDIKKVPDSAYHCSQCSEDISPIPNEQELRSHARQQHDY